jgi:hypothetical protein
MRAQNSNSSQTVPADEKAGITANNLGTMAVLRTVLTPDCRGSENAINFR